MKSRAEKLVLQVPRPLKATLWELADRLGVPLGEYVRGVLIAHCRTARQLDAREKELPPASPPTAPRT